MCHQPTINRGLAARTVAILPLRGADWTVVSHKVGMRKAKRADGVPRTITYRVRFAPDEYEDIKRKAGIAKISIADFIRRAAIGKQVRIYKPPPPVNRELYQELSAIGVNLNQLVRAMNRAVLAGTLVNVDVSAIANLASGMKIAIEQAQRDILGCSYDWEDNQE